MSGAVSLLANATVTGAGVTWPGGTGVFTAAGTFGGTIVALEVLGPDGATWLNAGSDGTLTAADSRVDHWRHARGHLRPRGQSLT
jgi:hypothetical protein